MISQLYLHNFKCFSNQTIPFAPLTLLVGANASGKSSVIQSLLLLRQSQHTNRLPEGHLLLKGPLVNIGMQRDAYNQERDDQKFAISLTDEHGDIAFRSTFDDQRATEYVIQGEALPSIGQRSLFQRPFNYLNAERLGPQLYYELSSEDTWQYDVGIHGQYTVPVLGRYGSEPVAINIVTDDRDVSMEATALPDVSEGPIELPDEPSQEAPPSTTTSAIPTSPPLGKEAVRWMQTIIPGFEFDAEVHEQTDQTTIRMRTSSNLGYVRPTNIGFGLIYTLPIIVAALVAPPESLLIVENPEAHLHPAGQSMIGRFLAHVAAAGVQVVVETHSDHVLNGIRRAVRDEILQPDQTAINFFVIASERGPQRVLHPRMYRNGGIRPWPRGFFDQFERDLRELL